MIYLARFLPQILTSYSNHIFLHWLEIPCLPYMGLLLCFLFCSLIFLLWWLLHCVCVGGHMHVCGFFVKTWHMQESEKSGSRPSARPHVDGLLPLSPVICQNAPGFPLMLFVQINLRIILSDFKNKSHVRHQLGFCWIYWLIAGKGIALPVLRLAAQRLEVFYHDEHFFCI